MQHAAGLAVQSVKRAREFTPLLLIEFTGAYFHLEDEEQELIIQLQELIIELFTRFTSDIYQS